jgi:penicillin-insensitive murein DD-endopeptidase
MKMSFKALLALAGALAIVAGDLEAAIAKDSRPAKQAFGTQISGSAQSPQPIGSYAKGCQAGAVQMPYDGENWQVMRLAGSRRWGQPQLVATLEQLAHDAATKDGWPGILIGDMSQPRGGPMINGHASHQIGLDVDIWYTPMPNRRMSGAEREKAAAISMLKKDEFLTVDSKIWTPAHARLVMRAASYPQVERIFVNPAIKKKLCDTWTGNRALLSKVRPLYGHDAHFHIRLSCPPGASSCKSQGAPSADDGCGKDLAYWYSPAPWKKPPPPDPDKPKAKPRVVTVDDLPSACSAVLASAPSRADDNMGVAIAPLKSADSEEGIVLAKLIGASASFAAAAEPETAPAQVQVSATAPVLGFAVLPDIVPVPKPRPLQ